MIRILYLIVIVILVVVGGWYCVDRYTSITSLSKEYQAVFLDNGQVYFGKITKQKEHTIKLENIYYLQTEKKNSDETTNDKTGDLSLVKLGNELHGPEDYMNINREHVLFIEDLRDDSKVVTAIRNYQK